MKKIKSITYAGKADVYNMEVEETHDFAVNGGVIVHNCYDEWRYLCMANPIAPRANMAKPLVLDDPLDLFKEKQTYNQYDFYRL